MVHPLNNDYLENGQVSAISSNISIFAHEMGNIGYVLKDYMGAAIFVRYSNRANAPIFRLVLFSKRSL